MGSKAAGIFALLVAGLFLVPVGKCEAPGAIVAAQLELGPKEILLSLETATPVAFDAFKLDGPPRVVLDLVGPDIPMAVQWKPDGFLSAVRWSLWRDRGDERIVRYVIETSAGCDRTLLTVLVDAFEEQQLEKDMRTVLHLHPAVAPIKAGIFPLVKKEGLPEIARKLQEELKQFYPVFYDEGGAVGRRYRRQDEIGTPYCFTIDFQTKEDETVTVRDRDTMEQQRIPISSVHDYLFKKIDKGE